MATMTAAEIRQEIAKRENLDPQEVRCYYCKYWGYNCGRAMNDLGESRCTARKNERTASYQFCRKFKLSEKKKKKIKT